MALGESGVSGLLKVTEESSRIEKELRRPSRWTSGKTLCFWGLCFPELKTESTIIVRVFRETPRRL